MAKDIFSKLLFGGATGLEVFGQLGDAKNVWKTGVINRSQAYEDASNAEIAGADAVEQFMRDARAKAGQQTAIASHQGGNTGSAQFILADLMNQLEKEKENMQISTQDRAASLRAEGDAHVRAGAHRKSQSYLKTGGTLLQRSYEFLDL